MDYLVGLSDFKHSDVKNIEFRSKEKYGWPGHVLVNSFSNNKQLLHPKSRMEVKDIYTPLACRTCFDKMNIFSNRGRQKDLEFFYILLKYYFLLDFKR